MSGQPAQPASPFPKKKQLFDAEDFDAVKLINQIYPDGTPSDGCHPPLADVVSSSRMLLRHKVPLGVSI